MAMSPLSRTSCTRLLPNPVEVPVMKKVRGMMALSIQVLLEVLSMLLMRKEGYIVDVAELSDLER